MNYSIPIFPEYGYIIERIEGEITFQGLLTKTKELFQQLFSGGMFIGVYGNVEGAAKFIGKPPLLEHLSD